VALFNSIGQLVQIYNLTNSQEEVNVVSFPNGFYLYRVSQNGKVKPTGRLSVQH